jgi:hypothetical protein
LAKRLTHFARKPAVASSVYYSVRVHVLGAYENPLYFAEEEEDYSDLAWVFTSTFSAPGKHTPSIVSMTLPLLSIQHNAIKL